MMFLRQILGEYMANMALLCCYSSDLGSGQKEPGARTQSDSDRIVCLKHLVHHQ